MIHKFACTCGQRISATPDLLRTVANCPECGVRFIVPSPPETTIRVIAPHVAGLLDRAAALGLAYRRPEHAEGDEGDIATLEEFFYELDIITGMLDDMRLTDEITRALTEQELWRIREAIWLKVLTGRWGATNHERSALIFESVPELKSGT